MPYIRRVSRFWFTYCDLSGHLLGALIVDLPTLLQARNRAAAEGTDAGAPYCEGYELDRAAANLIPAQVIGRMLNREEVRKLIRSLERRVANRAAAASVRPTGCVHAAQR